MEKESIFTTQRVYRILLQAMAHPGRIYSILQKTPYQVETEPEPLSLLSPLLETLLDRNVSFTVINDSNDYTREIELMTRSEVKEISEADFIIVFEGTTNGAIFNAKQGTLEHPEDGATAIYLVNACSNENKKGALFLNGPGIRKGIFISIDGLSREELNAHKSLRGNFPCGVDLIFIDVYGNLTCIPRSSTIKEVL